MNSLHITLAVLIWFAAAYFFYGRFISRTLGRPDDSQPTPAHTKCDGMDYSPAKVHFLWGNHFASIAGAGPIIGPILAVAVFGWGPVLLWVVLGAVFLGAVHDYLALMISVRQGGAGLQGLAEKVLGSSAGSVLAFLLYVLLVLLVAVFMVSVGQALINLPALVIPTFGLLAVGVLLGFALERWRIPELLAVPVAVVLAYGLIWVGYHVPLPLPAFMDHNAQLAFWLVVLAAYCLWASTAPIWVLLRPRDFISSVKLVVGMLLGFAGVVLLQPVVNAPIYNSGALAAGKPVWPMLFIMVACGAISGFHALVSSGTTARQLGRQSQARPIAFGGMIAEGTLAALVIMVVSAGLIWGKAPGGLSGPEANLYFGTALSKGWIVAFCSGFGHLVGKLEIPYLNAALAGLLGGVMVKSFILTTLDSGTRLGRFLVQESLGKKLGFLSGRYVSTLVVLLPALLLALTNTYGSLWKLFGAANQLVAAVALMTITVFLAREKLPLRYTLWPALFMLATTTAALLWEMFAPGRGYVLAQQPDYVLAALAGLLVLLGLVVAWRGVRAIRLAEATTPPQMEDDASRSFGHRVGM